MDEIKKNRNRGNIWVGLIIFVVGAGLLLHQFEFRFPFPSWMLSWPMIPIVIGLFIGIRDKFRGAAWLILIVIGSLFLFRDIYPDWSWHQYVWPLGLMLVGAAIIFGPGRKKREQWRDWGSETDAIPPTGEDFIDAVAIFGSARKNIFSKNFKGGDTVNIFGGTEINLSQADINGHVVLEVTQVFGGTKLIIPSNWELKTETAVIFGGIDDKRMVINTPINHEKVLVLRGTTIFGGIEIKSF